jgi:hypothetical protein
MAESVQETGKLNIAYCFYYLQKFGAHQFQAKKRQGQLLKDYPTF